MLRFALIGCGHHGRKAVMPGLLKHAGRVKLCAVADLHADNLASAKAMGCAVYTDYKQMLVEQRLDAVYIATLQEAHLEQVLAALSAGLHVVCEKPMAPTADDCRTMIEAAERAGRLLVVNFETRYHRHHQRIRQWIGDGRIGRVEAIHVQDFWDGHKRTGPVAERRARLMDRAGGLDCGIHKIDLVHHLCGSGQWASMEAMGAWLGEEERLLAPHIAILGRLDIGTLVTINASLGYAAGIKPRPRQDLLTVVGTEGVISLTIDSPSMKAHATGTYLATLYDNDGEEQVAAEYPIHDIAIGRLVDDLASYLESGTCPPDLPLGEAGLNAQVIAEAANERAVGTRFPATAPGMVGV
ncbi:Gfo/Idh/MocA family protein [Phycisphaerales bacterium AB-hyl4]|uniref:Gfo/Idh/MocA family protein n=1 Tax=Natronomicrosphaera hydrolytica TaxID=3242702 RepID=A0ABV4U3Z7_9BACT